MKILVGMSGGVDSTVTALLLKQAGYEVEGVIMKIWENNPNAKILPGHTSCYSPNNENIDEAKKAADEIGVRLNIIDCTDEYKKNVLNNFKAEYLSGRTPNPCVWCNSLIKFGALIDFSKNAGIEFDKFATGHYVKIENEWGRFVLKTAKDIKKDQTYFLYRLTQAQLSCIMTPLGDYTKDEIREIARQNGLETANKTDSQDFYNGTIGELINAPKKTGNIVDKEGKILGKHDGIWNFTIGQRRGIKISAPKPLYVAELKEKTNEVVVGYIEDIQKNFLYADNLNWIKFNEPPKKFKAFAKIRSAQSPKPVTIEVFSPNKIKAVFDEPQNSIAGGQSIVIYQDDYLLGGGIIC